MKGSEFRGIESQQSSLIILAWDSGFGFRGSGFKVIEFRI